MIAARCIVGGGIENIITPVYRCTLNACWTILRHLSSANLFPKRRPACYNGWADVPETVLCAEGGVEPHGFPHDFESCASACSATPANAKASDRIPAGVTAVKWMRWKHPQSGRARCNDEVRVLSAAAVGEEAIIAAAR